MALRGASIDQISCCVALERHMRIYMYLPGASTLATLPVILLELEGAPGNYQQLGEGWGGGEGGGRGERGERRGIISSQNGCQGL